jgi:hypothetical protein
MSHQIDPLARTRYIDPGLVSPKITRWQNFLSLDHIPRHGIALLCYTDFHLNRVYTCTVPRHIPGADPGNHRSPIHCGNLSIGITNFAKLLP